MSLTLLPIGSGAVEVSGAEPAWQISAHLSLSHLRNLSAGIGAAGLFGLLSPETEYQGGI